MDTALLEKYARLIIEAGVALKEGQNLKITSEPVHWDFVNLLIKEAYEAGARFVEPRLVHPLAAVHRANLSRDEYLDYVPKTAVSEIEAQVEEDWAFLRIEGKENPDVFKGMNQDKNAVIARAVSESGKPLRNAMLAREKSWCVAPMPTAGWAAQVLGIEADDGARDALFDVLAPILRLDSEDPVTAWKAHGEALFRRCDRLNDLSLEQIRFQASGTDLTVHLIPGSRWLGGPLTTTDGRVHFPNLPTEEVFITPDYRKTTGRTRTTKPVTVLGSQVRGAWFEFKDGRVEDYGADDGRHLLDKYFEIDPKNRYLGEVALVDERSPIARCGLVFNTILIDENAACHFALGSGYPAALSDAEGLSEDDLDLAGCNKALFHVDFMIGSADTLVTGLSRGGEQITLMDGGELTV